MYLIMMRMFIAILDSHYVEVLKELGSDANLTLMQIIKNAISDWYD